MSKSISKVNMKLLFSIGIVITIFTASPLITNDVFAIIDENPAYGPLIDSGEGYAVGAPVKKTAQKERTNIITNVIDFILKNAVNTDRPDEGTIGVTPGVTSIPITGVPYAGTFKYYRQCNYKSTPLRDGCDMCYAGCGITAASGILSTLVDQTLDPPTVLKKYTALEQGSGCYGSSIMSGKTVLESYGLTTSNYLFRSANGERIENVADDMRPYLKSGWFIFALAYFCSGGCGHFIVITDIDSSNNVTSFDPYYEPPVDSAQPIGYSRRSPYPLYRYGFAVKKN